MLSVFDDKNYTYYDEFHPQLNGVMFWDQHPQPSNDSCVGNILKQNHGKINGETLYRQVAGLHETGNS